MHKHVRLYVCLKCTANVLSCAVGIIVVAIIIIIILLLYSMDVSCHRLFLPGTSLEPAVIPTA